ncbi:MAG TPA: histone family protein [Candidatus Nanoarchaeia archaeon]|nr:histone family protein [Candidatus Woesearchaeota archaeon]HLF53842.1 histone family protein [Candidatus Nanoarchaeia archaeon]
MGRKTSIIPKAPVGRILLNAGAKRVSSGAVSAFTEILTEKALQIANKASQIAKHSGRVTVHEGDVKLAAK